MDYSEESPIVLSLCSGILGIERGMDRAFEGLGWRKPTIVAYVEIEAFIIENLVQQMEQGVLAPTPIWSNLKTFPSKQFHGKIHGITGGYPCFIAGTKILTKKGYVSIESVCNGDEVLTHLGRWRRVTSTMSKHNAPIREVKAQGSVNRCTDEHPFFTREEKWVEAKNIKGERICQVLPMVYQNDMPAEQWWVIGRYLADGWRQSSPSQHGKGRVVICGNKNEESILEQKIKSAGFNPYKNQERTVVRFTITRQWFYDFLEQFGSKSHGKLLPGWVLSLDKYKAKELMDGYLSGDGYRYKNPKGKGEGWRVTTTSESLAYSIALLAQRSHGVVASLRKYVSKPTKKIENRLVKDLFFVVIPDKNRSGEIKGEYGYKLARKSEPCGIADVFNIAVEEDESYVANGAIVHNCQPFSVAGNRKGTEDPRHLWPYIKTMVGAIEPVWCFFENVRGHLNLGFEQVHSDLQRLGYEVRFGIFSAEEVGAPHRRERLFILAIKMEYLVNSTGCGNIGGLRQLVTQNEELKARKESWKNERCQSVDANSKMDDSYCQSMWNNIGRIHREVTSTSFEIADRISKGLERQWNEEISTKQRFTRSSGVCNNVWPSRPGQPQHEWEAPRVISKIKSGFCESVNGNEDGIDVLCLKKRYETYTADKESAIKELHHLWEYLNSEKISARQSVRGFFDILEEKILWSKVLAKSTPQRLQIIANAKENFQEIKEIRMRTLQLEGKTSSASYRQECVEFVRKEFANAMCILSCQITLAIRQESSNVDYDKAMRYLWDNFKNPCWDVSKTLSEIQKIWGFSHDENKRKEQLMEAYKSYRLELFDHLFEYNYREDLLRMAGNGVVEQAAALAFITLVKKF